MKHDLVITDVTRMWGKRVCIAGINTKGDTIRPIFDEGDVVNEDWLYDNKSNVVIHPFALVSFDFLRHKPAVPHSEDWIIDVNFKKKKSVLSVKDRKKHLDNFSFKDVENIFEGKIHQGPGYYIREGEGVRSLGTVRASVTNFFYGENDFGRWDYRISFSDKSNHEYSLKVTDLSFVYYCNYLRNNEGLSNDTVSKYLKKELSSKQTFLRVGLARPNWPEHPHCCFLQITGVYTFPDCLEGRCFADFS